MVSTLAPWHPGTLAPSPDVVFRALDGDAVLLDLASGTYFGLNQVGTRIWQLLDEGLAVEAIVDRLAAEYEAPPSTIEADVVRLLEELQSRRLIRPVEAPP